jgi:predicted 3-demethylubiquinone-9 3-methyltransferase (glyoxalase superfamily)
MQRIVTHLWFDNQAEDAAKLYTSIFKNSRIRRVARVGESGARVTGKPMGGVMTVGFELDGQEFYALNGGPLFKFNEAMSLVVNCENQTELDYFWEKLLEGGQPQQCGWLKDRFGVSWQIIPRALAEMMSDQDSKKSERVMKAMLQMVKIDIQVLQQAYVQ